MSTEQRLQLLRGGYSPIPCEGKRPVHKAWQQRHATNPDDIELWTTLFPSAGNTGLLTRLTPAIDIDITDAEAADAVEALARERFEEHGYLLVRTGKAPKRAILLRTDRPFPKITRSLAAPNGGEHKIEILCDGQQVIAFGIHPDTNKLYTWHGGEPGQIALEDLPYVNHADMVKFSDTAVELLAKEFGYRAAPTRKSRETSNGGGVNDWALLTKNVLEGRGLHDSLCALAAKLIASGMSEGAAVNLLRGLMDASSVPHNGRWQERRDEIPRLVSSAAEKLRGPQPKPSEPEPENENSVDRLNRTHEPMLTDDGREIEISRLRITDAGRRALASPEA